jgi:hypothetical protein
LLLVDIAAAEIGLQLAEDEVDLEVPGHDLIVDLLEDVFDGGLWTILIAAKLLLLIVTN